ncbi:uncharacterized protein LOC144916109 [Branchiostoma floridae x Branchiostoma belcheri]
MGLVCSTGGDLAVPGSVVGCPICDNRPSEQATWAGQIPLTHDRLRHLARWNEQAPFFTTFEGLVDYLTGQTASDIERFWVLFHWIQLECRRQQTHKPTTEDSPWGFLRAVQNGTRSHAELYKKLCRTAGIRCKTVTGLCKSIGDTSFEPSVNEGTYKSSWNEVTINGRRSLVDCRLELDFEQIRIPPFYFLAQPTHFATTHYPDNKSYQLLEVNVTLEQFQGHVACFPAFFDLDKDSIDHHSADVRTNDGVAVLKFGANKPVKCCLQTLNRITVQRKFDLSRHIKQIKASLDSPTVTVVVRPPFTGRFSLKVSVQDEKSDTSMPVCMYTIVCGETAADCSPFENDTAESHQKKIRTSTSSQDGRHQPAKPNRPSSISWSDEPVTSPQGSRSVRKRPHKDEHSEVVSGVSRGENAPSVQIDADYPKTYKAWTGHCVLHRPRARSLSKGALVKFKLAVPYMTRMVVLLPHSEDGHGYKTVSLKSRDGGTTWKGKAMIPDRNDAERRYVFVVGTPKDTNEGQYLLEYDIGDRNPPEGESMEDHGSDLKLDHLQDSRLKPLPDGFTYHVMISYSWAQQEVILKVKEHLNKDGYRVWLDKDEMSGTMLESMARGVRSSAIVIIAVSEDYVASDNCKREANFARDKKREIIPLKMTTYYPDNWLGMLISGKYYVDFSSPGPLSDKLKDLKFQIEDRLKKIGSMNYEVS